MKTESTAALNKSMMSMAHQLMQVEQRGHHVWAVAWPLCTGIAQQEELPQVDILLQAGHAEQPGLVDEVDGKVQLLQGLTVLQVLDLGDVVQGHIQVFQLLQLAGCLSDQQA